MQSQFFLSEKNVTLLHANNNVTDQSAHPRSLISASAVRFLESILATIHSCKTSRLLLVSVAEQASISLTWAQTPKTVFPASRPKCSQYQTGNEVIFIMEVD